MKFPSMLLASIALTVPPPASARDSQLVLPDFTALSQRATDSVNIDLGPFLLHMAGALVDLDDAEGAAVKQLLAGIDSLRVRNFEFGTDFAYSRDELDRLRRQLSGPGWNSLVHVHDGANREDVDMYVAMDAHRARGLALIVSEPREVTIIDIVGSVGLDDLPRLAKQLNIRQLNAAPWAKL